MVADLLFRHARVVDGTGAASRIADVAVAGDTIVEIADQVDAQARRVVDASGLTLAPGFIDIHTHSDFSLPVYPRAESMTSQGVTTQVVGNCGFSPFPVGQDDGVALRTYSAFLDAGLPWGTWSSANEFLSLLEGLPLACNVATQVGHGSVRMAVMGFDTGPPSSAQLQAMRDLVADAMDAGTFGMSTGLTYAPASGAHVEELIALAKVVSDYGGFYSTHVRSEATRLVEAIEEALLIGEQADLPVQLSHHKAIGEKNWDKIITTLGIVDRALARGQDVSMDVYPYTAGSTGLVVVLPRWALEGGVEQMRSRLADPSLRATIREQIWSQRIEDLEAGLREFTPDSVVIADVPPGSLEAYIGLTLTEIARIRQEDPVDAALALLEAGGGDVLTIVHGQSEDNIRRIMTHPATMIASDGWTLSPRQEGRPHPRNYGTYARFLGRYVRDEGVLPLETAIRKVTSLPAARLGLARRGTVREGHVADLVLFDAARVIDCATFKDPHQFCEGVFMVVVNGQVVIDEDGYTESAGGRVLRRGAEQ